MHTHTGDPQLAVMQQCSDKDSEEDVEVNELKCLKKTGFADVLWGKKWIHRVC